MGEPQVPVRNAILHELLTERLRQEQFYSDFEKDPHDWVAKICKYTGAACMHPADVPGVALDRLRSHMVKVGALAIAAIEWTDRELARLTKEGTYASHDAMSDLRVRKTPR